MNFLEIIISLFLKVDDEFFNLMGLEKMLKLCSLNSNSALNGEEALQKIEEKCKNPCNLCNHKNYFLIFMDINMPILNGLETT